MGAEAVGVRPIQIARNGVDGAAVGSGWDFPVVHSLLDAKSLL